MLDVREREQRLGFARHLRQWREVMGLKNQGKEPGKFTQEEAAETLGFHPVTYCNWENGRSSIKWFHYETVMKIIADTMDFVTAEKGEEDAFEV